MKIRLFHSRAILVEYWPYMVCVVGKDRNTPEAIVRYRISALVYAELRITRSRAVSIESSVMVLGKIIWFKFEMY